MLLVGLGLAAQRRKGRVALCNMVGLSDCWSFRRVCLVSCMRSNAAPRTPLPKVHQNLSWHHNLLILCLQLPTPHMFLRISLHLEGTCCYVIAEHGHGSCVAYCFSLASFVQSSCLFAFGVATLLVLSLLVGTSFICRGCSKHARLPQCMHISQTSRRVYVR